MVDIGSKTPSRRWARVRGWITMRPETLRAILSRELSKGDVIEVARLAGIMAAKRTDELIPLCHQVPLTSVRLEFGADSHERLRIEARVEAEAPTGVEMEAFTAVSLAALTVYDMCKGVDREMQIGPIQLEEKAGGRSGHFLRTAAAASAGPLAGNAFPDLAHPDLAPPDLKESP